MTPAEARAAFRDADEKDAAEGAHIHVRLVDGCYRCELNKDEIRDYIDSLRVTRSGVVHDPDCSFVSGVTSSAIPWRAEQRWATDRACTRCLPDGLPVRP